MQEINKKSAGLLVAVTDPETGRKIPVLQVRAETDSYPGACQVTAHGKLKGDELTVPSNAGYRDALLREAKEELGPAISAIIAENIEASQTSLVLLNHQLDSEKGKEVKTFGVALDLTLQEFNKLVLPETGVSFRPCHNWREILELKPEHKTTARPRDQTFMFKDEGEAVKTFVQEVLEANPSSSRDTTAPQSLM